MMIKITEKGDGIRPAGYPALATGQERDDLPADLEARLIANGEAIKLSGKGKARVMISQEPSKAYDADDVGGIDK